MPDPIINLDKKIPSRFNGLEKELLNLKDVIIRDIKAEKQPIHMKVNNLEKNIMSRKIKGNHLEQYERRNILEIRGIPDDANDQNLEEEKVVKVLSEIKINVSSSDV